MPKVNVYVGDRLASVDVGQLDVDVGVDTALVFTDIPADVLAVNV